MTDGWLEAGLSLHMKDIIAKFWKAKNIFELEDDFELLFRLYEEVKKQQRETAQERNKFKRYGRR